MKKLIIVFLEMALLGCASAAYQQKVQATMDGYIGRHYAELQDQMGPPTRVSDDGRGGRILSWASEQEVTSGSTYTPPQRQTKGSGFAAGFQRGLQSVQTHSSTSRIAGEYLDVWVDQEGIIYQWKWRSD